MDKRDIVYNFLKNNMCYLTDQKFNDSCGEISQTFISNKKGINLTLVVRFNVRLKYITDVTVTQSRNIQRIYDLRSGKPIIV